MLGVKFLNRDLGIWKPLLGQRQKHLPPKFLHTPKGGRSARSERDPAYAHKTLPQKIVCEVPRLRNSFSSPLHAQWRCTDGKGTHYPRCPRTVSHHFTERADVGTDAFLHATALLERALTLARIQTIAASTGKVLVRKSGNVVFLAPCQRDEVYHIKSRLFHLDIHFLLLLLEMFENTANKKADLTSTSKVVIKSAECAVCNYASKISNR